MREWGVVNRVLPGDQLHEKAQRYAARLAAGPTLAHAATKRVLRAYLDGGVEAADAVLPEVGARVIVSDDLQAGVDSLLAKGPGNAVFANR
jgi:enoyl-CoA hydratase/carnithine racemase